jgi:hypothetical protein
VPAPSWAVPGVMVVCTINDWCNQDTVTCPVKNIVYTIRDVSMEPCGRCSMSEHVYLRLEEIRNESRMCVLRCGRTEEPGFAHVYFRPVKTTSIDDLVSLTKTPPTELPLDADKRPRRRTRENA